MYASNDLYIKLLKDKLNINHTPYLSKQLNLGNITLKNIKNQSQKICLIAVKHNGNNLKYVKEQTNEICLEAIKQNKNQIKNIECINSEILIYILDNYIFFKNEIDYIKNLITDDLLSDILYYYDFKKIKKILNININEYELIIKCSNIYHII